jgi:hypothetical protein
MSSTHSDSEFTEWVTMGAHGPERVQVDPMNIVGYGGIQLDLASVLGLPRAACACGQHGDGEPVPDQPIQEATNGE